MSEDKPEPEYFYSQRGFLQLPPIIDTYENRVRVYESSSATVAGICLSTEGNTIHLDKAGARQLIDQLQWLVDNHPLKEDDSE